MAKFTIQRGAISQILHVFVQDSTVTTGAGKTGLVFNTAGLACKKIRDGETLSASVTLEDISTLGTYAAPTSNAHVRFKEVSSASPTQGLYEIHLHNDWVDNTNARRSLVIMLGGATGMAQLAIEIQIVDPVRGLGSPTAIPNAAAEAAGGLYTRGTGAGQINQSANGQIDVNAERLNNAAQSLLDLKDFADDGYDPTTNKVQGVVLVDTLTTYTGNTPQTGDSYAIVNSGVHGNAAIKDYVDDIGVAGAGLTALGDARIANLDAAITSRMATFTLPTNFSALNIDSSGIVDADVRQLLGTAWLTPATAGTPDVNAKLIGGTTQTGRDVGESVLLSSGTGTGQVKLSGGYVAPNWGDVGNPSTAVNLSATTVNLVNTLTTYTGNTVQTGDSFARIGATGSGLTSLAQASVCTEVRLAHLDADITSRLAPTVAGRTLDVSAGGEAGVDWANVGSPTTVVGLSGTTVKTATDVETDTQDIQSRLPAALVSGRIDSSVGAYQSGLTPILPTTSATADSGTATTVVDAERTESDTDYWKGSWIRFTSGNISGQVRYITGFDATTDTITFTPATTQAVTTQTYDILPAGGVDLVQWLESTPNALVSGRVDSSTGAYQSGQAPLQPTVSGRTLDVTTTGEAGIDLDNTVGTLSSAEIPNLDAAITTRMATFTLPPNFSALNIDASGIVDADVRQLLGTAWLTPAAAGIPDVNVKLWNSLTAVALPLVPTVAGRTLDVTAAGEAGIDWANIGSPTTTQTLSGTTIGTITTYTGNTPQTGDSYARLGAPAGASVSADIALLQSDTDNIQTRLPTTLVGGRMDAHVGVMAAGVLTAAAIAADAITADKIAAGAIGVSEAPNLDAAVSSRLAPTVPGRTLDVAAGGEAGIDLDNTAGTLAKDSEIIGFNDLNAAGVRSAMGLVAANLDVQLAAIAGYVDTEVAAIKAKTDQLNFTGSYVQCILFRWLTNDPAGTPLALSSNKVQADAAAVISSADKDDIVDRIFDEMSDDHLIPGSTGYIIGNLERRGAGTAHVELVIRDVGGNTIAGASVWVTTGDDPLTDVVAGTEFTDDFGKVQFLLTPGTGFRRWCHRGGTNFNNPQLFDVI